MKFIVLDYGSPSIGKIDNRIVEIGHDFTNVDSQITSQQVKEYQPDGIIISGSPDTVYDGGRKIDEKIYELGIPVLGICYGMQLTNYMFGGVVQRSLTPEFKIMVETTLKPSPLFKNMPGDVQMYMAHYDEVVKLAEGFENIASTANCKIAACHCIERNLYCTQFHPEDEKNVYGKQLFENFAEICKKNKGK